MNTLTYESLHRASPPTRMSRAARPLLALGVIAAAYHVSLGSLLDALRLDTPTAHIALVPPLALGLAVLRRRGMPAAPVDDRQVDWIVGIPLLVVAVAISLWLPRELSGDYWAERVDLLSLPFFAGGVVALLFGVRTLWHYRLPVVYLLLAWPKPYNALLDRGLGRFTELTVDALALTNVVFRLARRADDDGSLFSVMYRGEEVTLSVASACSGANGVVGFFVVGTALVFTVRGSRKAKALWLVCGAFLVWVFNLVRILALFAAVRWKGESFAIDGLHPVAGLITFTLAMIVMLAVMPMFGLRITDAAGPPVPATAGPRLPRRPAARLAGGVVLATATLLGATNLGLHDASQISDSLGTPRLAPFDRTRVEPRGFELNVQQDINWARRFFGRQSTWRRYAYIQTGDAAPAVNQPIYLDVIDTADQSALRAYGVEACYRFHNYAIASDRKVMLGYGIEAGILSWTNRRNQSSWTTVYWQWRVKHDTTTRFERMTLIMSSDANADDSDLSPADDPSSARAIERSAVAPRSVKARVAADEELLVGFARSIVDLRVAS